MCNDRCDSDPKYGEEVIMRDCCPWSLHAIRRARVLLPPFRYLLCSSHEMMESRQSGTWETARARRGISRHTQWRVIGGWGLFNIGWPCHEPLRALLQVTLPLTSRGGIPGEHCRLGATPVSFELCTSQSSGMVACRTGKLGVNGL